MDENAQISGRHPRHQAQDLGHDRTLADQIVVELRLAKTLGLRRQPLRAARRLGRHRGHRSGCRQHVEMFPGHAIRRLRGLGVKDPERELARDHGNAEHAAASLASELGDVTRQHGSPVSQRPPGELGIEGRSAGSVFSVVTAPRRPSRSVVFGDLHRDSAGLRQHLSREPGEPRPDFGGGPHRVEPDGQLEEQGQMLRGVLAAHHSHRVGTQI